METVPSTEESPYKLVVQHGPIIAPDVTYDNYELKLVNDDCLPRNLYYYMELDGPVIPDNSIVVFTATFWVNLNPYYEYPYKCGKDGKTCP